MHLSMSWYLKSPAIWVAIKIVTKTRTEDFLLIETNTRLPKLEWMYPISILNHEIIVFCCIRFTCLVTKLLQWQQKSANQSLCQKAFIYSCRDYLIRSWCAGCILFTGYITNNKVVKQHIYIYSGSGDDIRSWRVQYLGWIIIRSHCLIRLKLCLTISLGYDVIRCWCVQYLSWIIKLVMFAVSCSRAKLPGWLPWQQKTANHSQISN